MNLLNEMESIDIGNIVDFRKEQYKLINPMVNNILYYLHSLGFQYSEIKSKKEYSNSYNSQNQFENTTIYVWLDDNSKPVLILNYPTLIDEMFFKLKGVLYIPQLYIADEPITIKKESVILYSLFQPITIYHKDGIVIFLGKNIPISRFLNLFYKKSEVEDICDSLNTLYLDEDIDYVLKTISEMFNVKKDIDEIRKLFNKLFFDYWTKGLYEKFYNQEINDIKELLDLYLKNIDNEKSFIDLEYKRLTFLEIYFRPLFDIVGRLSANMITQPGFKPLVINTDIKLISSYFSNKLNNETIYDLVNGYTINSGLKATFKNPKSNNTHLPPEISDIDKTFKNNVCPLSISNKNPGRVVSLIPTLNVDPKYGMFLNIRESNRTY